MVPQITIRSATMDDLPTLLEFQQGIVQAERPFDPTLKDGELQYHDIPSIIASTDSELVVAVADGSLIGCGYGQIRNAKDYLRHVQFCYVGLIFVRPEYRGKGANHLILDALKAWSRARNIFELRLEVYDDNVRAKRAYEKEGFKPHMLLMRTDLSN
ncbi:GNAT family N-acetyltransferase [Chryseolinea sp. T2]|uniref:GNAT family N-acetyltransferase n=1 Tax=Chryseolinea sp. T2 TaxID=3129255 RepID=UPI003077C0CD